METSNDIGENMPAETAPDSNDISNRRYAMFAHLAGPLGFGFSPFIGNIIAPLIIWLYKRNDLPLVNHAGKEALNFQISMSLYLFISFATFAYGGAEGNEICAWTGLVCGAACIPWYFIMIILATIWAGRGKKFKYPLSIRFIK